MKNKVIFRIISLALLVILCLGAVSCANGGGADGTSDTTGASDTTAASTDAGTTAGTTAETDDKGDSTGAKSDEELFAEILSAYEASMAYDGAMTIKATQSEVEQEGEDNDSTTAVATASFDPETLSVFVATDMVSGTRGQHVTEKVFSVDGTIYSYTGQKAMMDDSEPQTYESFSKLGADAKDEIIADCKDYFDAVDKMIGGVVKAESYKGLKDAFAKVYAEVKDRDIKELKEDGAITDDATVTLDNEISIKSENGETVLTIVSSSNISAYADGSAKNLKNDLTRVIACKDGKISKVYVTLGISGDIVEDEDEMKISIQSDIAYDITYSFDKAAYDAIDTTLPSDSTQIKDVGNDTRGFVVLHFGEYIEDEEYIGNEPASQWFNSVTSNIKYRYGFEFVMENDNEVEIPYVTVKGFYKDAALTQAIDIDTITTEELRKLGDVYVDYSIKEGFAIVSEEYSSVDEYSLDYQIVVWSPFMSYMSSGNDARLVNVETPYTLDLAGEGYRYLVNGTVVDGNSVTLESGKTYCIEQVRINTDEDVHMDDLGIDMD